ncbi:hypothetical protein Pst134EA_028829 [Puccinia striiformis f. sp. tritici]|uniref:hypothetical protein n=1 Tax=Puccinia striiformis f. sp. tritici TaxID=168172 RepID=UPI002007E03A|nr:hypothetical protein Pst134EA_028829 [Puccinia striiformis f. sp. tritici]KAH9446843.1 hypothetical protein Pst134EA_028829 [Puccinia striiformis f. sp. tritici]
MPPRSLHILVILPKWQVSPSAWTLQKEKEELSHPCDRPAVTPLLPHRFHLTHSVVIMRDKWKKKRVRRLKRKRRKMRARSK